MTAAHPIRPGRRYTLPPGHVFTGTPEETFTEIYTLFRDRIEAFVVFRLPHRDRHLAEDLAQETFAELWRHIARGKPIDDRVFGLLATMARHRIRDHRNLKRSGERPADFTDPATRPAVAPPSTAPHLAWLYADLERAKDTLSEAARVYQRARITAGGAEGNLKRAKAPTVVARWTSRHQAAVKAVNEALDAFQTAADRVARLRAAWNQAADSHPVLEAAR